MNKFGLKHFKQYQEYIYKHYGINYTEQKADLLQSKINKVMRNNQIESYDQLFKSLQIGNNGKLLNEFQDEITIHKTDFFRENSHFAFLKKNFDHIMLHNPRIRENKEIRVWSSACASGEEPYTIAMVLKEILPEAYTIKILGTDISRKVLLQAQQGLYPARIAQDIEKYYLLKYFQRQGDHFDIRQEIRQRVTFRQFNLVDPFPFRNKFDIIFCRNVMIYFDGDNQSRLLEKFHQVLIAGGILFLGLSEALRDKTHYYKPLGPSIYRKT